MFTYVVNVYVCVYSQLFYFILFYTPRKTNKNKQKLTSKINSQLHKYIILCCNVSFYQFSHLYFVNFIQKSASENEQQILFNQGTFMNGLYVIF